MIQNRVAVSRYELQKLSEKNHDKGVRIKKEIEKLLNDYNYLYADQIYRWFDVKDQFVVKKFLKKIMHDKNLVYDADTGIIQNIAYYDSFDEKFLNAFWVMIALNNIQKKMGNHIYLHLPSSKNNSCKKISFFITPTARESQILVIRKGEEQSASYEVNLKECTEEQYLPERFILIDSPEQIPYIDIKNVIAYAQVIDDGKVQFIQNSK